VLKGDGKSLIFLVKPDWRTIVHPEDLDYLESLLQDLPVRAALNAQALFKQLCSLGVGPLVAVEAGESISDHPAFAELRSTFLEL
jgi:hypothetical protein